MELVKNPRLQLLKNLHALRTFFVKQVMPVDGRKHGPIFRGWRPSCRYKMHHRFLDPWYGNADGKVLQRQADFPIQSEVINVVHNTFLYGKRRVVLISREFVVEARCLEIEIQGYNSESQLREVDGRIRESQ